MNPVTEVLIESLKNIVKEVWIFTIAFVIFLMILALVIRGIKKIWRKLLAKIKNKFNTSRS